VIEVDGDQHFKDVALWNSIAVDNRRRDVFKMECLFKNGIRLLRIQQTLLAEFFKTPVEWQEQIKRVIETPSSSMLTLIMNSKCSALYDQHLQDLHDTTISTDKIRI
jgi:very-short-patch-repair endonuclease